MKLFDGSQPTGMPRPIARHKTGKLPVPWSQAISTRGPSWGVLDDDLAGEAMDKSLCLVCGEPVVKGLVFVSLPDRSAPPTAIFNRDLLAEIREGIIDHGPLHERCARLTAAHCPTLKERLDEGQVVLCPYLDNYPTTR